MNETGEMPLGWKLAALVAGALGLAIVVTVCWFGFALLAIWLRLPGEGSRGEDDMHSLERDKLRETRAAHDEIPFVWKLGACVVLLLVAIGLATVLILPLSCLVNNWPEPVCEMFQAITGQAKKGGQAMPVTTSPSPIERSAP